MEKRRLPQSANDLTAHLLVELPKAFRGLRCWRQSVGGAYPIQSIRALRSHLERGDAAAALEALNRTRPIIMGGIPGLADIGGLMPDGRALGVEVKWGNDKPSDEQLTCQRVFEAAGAVYIIARSVDQCLADLKKFT